MLNTKTRRNFRWNSDITNELITFVKDNESIMKPDEIFEKFAKKYEGLDAGRVRIHFYKSKENNENKKESNRWNPEDDKKLINLIDNNPDKTKVQLFEMASEMFGKKTDAIISHYYFLKRTNSKIAEGEHVKNMLDFINDMTIDKMIEFLQELKMNTNSRIRELVLEVENQKNTILDLQEQLNKKDSVINDIIKSVNS